MKVSIKLVGGSGKEFAEVGEILKKLAKMVQMLLLRVGSIWFGGFGTFWYI